MNPTKESLFRQ